MSTHGGSEAPQQHIAIHEIVPTCQEGLICIGMISWRDNFISHFIMMGVGGGVGLLSRDCQMGEELIDLFCK